MKNLYIELPTNKYIIGKEINIYQIINSSFIVITSLITLTNCGNNTTLTTSPTTYLSHKNNSYPSLAVTPILPTEKNTSTPFPSHTSSVSPTMTTQGIENNWTILGPDGGTVDIIVIDPISTINIYAVSRIGIFKSIDSGEHWNQINTNLPEGIEVVNLVIDPLTTTTLYSVVLTENATRTGKIFKSTDGGVVWNPLNMDHISCIVIDPIIPDTLYAGGTEGIYKSINGGESWDQISRIEITDMIINPIYTNILYGSNYSSVYKSEDGGITWIKLGNIPGLEPDRICSVMVIEIDPITPATLYVWTCDGLMKSINGGYDWVELDTHITGNNGIWSLVIDPGNPTTLYAGSSNKGVFKSTNGGKNWFQSNSDLFFIEVNSLAVDPKKPNTLYVGTSKGGVYKSTNGGVGWYAMNSGLHSTIGINSLVIDPLTSTTLYADGQVLYKSTNSGKDWALISMYNGHGLTIDPQKPNTLYQAISLPFLEKYNDNGEYRYYQRYRALVLKSINGGGRWIYGDELVVDNSISTLVIDPIETNILYAGIIDPVPQGGVYKSFDSGITWTNIGMNDIGIYTLVIDPSTHTTLYAGTKSNGVYKSYDGGNEWVAINNGIDKNNITSLAIDPMTPATLYAETFGGGLYKSADCGMNWYSIRNGLPNKVINYSLVLDTTTPNILYIGTNEGVYKSINGGESWFSIGLTDHAVGPIAIDPKNPTIIYVGTLIGVYVVKQAT